MIRAPFNFVPLNDKVFFPNWADQISQDIPFSDGLSGYVDILIKAESPILVSEGVKERGQTHYFCHTPAENMSNWKYFIPGTSIKGAIRNVLEILSFGKMSFTQNRSFTIRDLYKGKKDNDDEIKTDGDFYLEKINIETVHCGWMRKTSDGCFIDDCGTPWRISAEKIDTMFKDKEIDLGLTDFILDNTKFSNSDENKGNRNAKKKYDILKDALGITSEDSFENDIKESLTNYFVNDNDTNIAKCGRILKCQGAGGQKGTIVFTGQPGARRMKDGKWEGKFFEFIFPSEVLRHNIHVPEGVYRAFETIHKDSPDYEGFRRKQLNEGKQIPVFFTYCSNNADEIDSVGISYMYRYPAFNSVYNGIPIELLDLKRRDLPECIFGYTSQNDSLKGRVVFSNAFLVGDPIDLQKNYALASPHASFYPLYLGNGQSWNSQEIRIAGRKRYPAKNNQRGNRGTSNMESPKRPLGRGSEFKCQVHFFNLKPIEFGALLSSLDFCGHNECCHSLGQGKPLGYGKVKIIIDNISFDNGNIDIVAARDSFTDAMNEESELRNWPERWEDSVQLKELFSMAEGIPIGRDEDFTYMQMSVKATDGKKHNEFKDALKDYKDNGVQLGRYTQIISNTVPVSSMQDMASLNEGRNDIESYLTCKAKAEEIVKLGFIPSETQPEDLIWTESVLTSTKDVFGDDIEGLITLFSELIKPQKEKLREIKAKEAEEIEVILAKEKEEEQVRLAQERELALKQKEEERQAKNEAKNEWKKKQKEILKNEKGSAPSSIPEKPISLSFTEQLKSVPSVGQLTKLIENHFKQKKDTELSTEELYALSEGIKNVIHSLEGKMKKADLIQKGAWRADGSLWKKVTDVIGKERFESSFPEF